MYNRGGLSPSVDDVVDVPLPFFTSAVFRIPEQKPFRNEEKWINIPWSFLLVSLFCLFDFAINLSLDCRMIRMQAPRGLTRHKGYFKERCTHQLLDCQYTKQCYEGHEVYVDRLGGGSQ